MMRRLPDMVRWSACFGVALGIHVAVAAVLMSRFGDEAAEAANAPVLMVDMTPVSAAPTAVPTDLPPDMVRRDFQAGEPEPQPEKPEEVVEDKPAEPEKPVEVAKVEPEPEKPIKVKPEPKAELSLLPPPKSVEKIDDKKPDEKKKEVKKKPPKRQTSLASAPSAADRQADRASAAQASAAANGAAMPDWRARVAAAIARHKRYPSDAQSRGEQGVANVSFLVDGSGRVHNARLARSTGSSSLDNDAIAWVMRAQPLPAPPGEKSIQVTLPLSYTIR